MKFEKIKFLPIFILYFFIESLFIEINIIYGSLIYFILLFLYFMYEFKKQDIKVKHIIRNLPSFKELISYFFITLGLLLISITFIQLISNLLYLFAPPDISENLLDSSVDTMPMWLTFALAVIVAPIVEEFMFRGIILNKLGKKYNIYIGVFVNSIIFAILHLDIYGAFLFGLVSSVLYAKTKSIIGPIIIHFFNNLIAFLPSLMVNNTSSNDIPSEILTNAEYLELIKLNLFLIVLFSIPILIYILDNWVYLKQVDYIEDIIENDESLTDNNLKFITNDSENINSTIADNFEDMDNTIID